MEITGKEAIRLMLEAEGVRYVFGNPGSTEIPILDALSGHPETQFILALHEGIAVAMADGYARASGRPGVVAVHACPGTAQTLGMLYSSYVSGVPLVVLAGQQDSRLIIREPFLSADLARLVEPVTKWSWEVSRIEQMPIALRRAFKEATSPPTGPVFLSLPKNVLDERCDFDLVSPDRYRLSAASRGDSMQIRRAAELLAAARRPVIIVGHRAIANGSTGPHAELVELAELLAAPVYGDTAAFPTSHPLSFGTFERRQLAGLLKDSDVLLVVGSDMFSEFVYSPTPLVPAGLKAIHIDSDPWEIAKNFPLEAGIVADPKVALRELLDVLRARQTEADSQTIAKRRPQVTAAKEELKAELAREAASWGSYPLRIGTIVQHLRQLLDKDAIVVEQAIHSAAYLKKYCEFDAPGTYFGEQGGTIGWVLGASLGIKLAQPQRQVVAFAGDGATMFSPQAIWTAAQHDIAVTMLVVNNGGYMAVRALSMIYGAEWAQRGEFIGADIRGIDYVKLAESMGVAAQRIEKAEEIRPTLQWGLSQAKPTLIELVVDDRDAGYGYPRVP